MTDVLEIEKAIERLPEPDQKKIAEWLIDHRHVSESSSVLASIYDQEDKGESQLTEQ